MQDRFTADTIAERKVDFLQHVLTKADETGADPVGFGHELTRGAMKILVVHNRYRQSGGEDAVVRAESSLLARMGHDVEVWEESNDSIVGTLEKIKTAFQCVYSFRHARQMQRQIRNHRPDLVHIHNFFPRMSPSVHMTCRRMNIPVVQTLHNFRLLCPAATFHGHGSICEDCLRKSMPWPAVTDSCYRKSRLGSLVVANMLALHRVPGTWNRTVSQFIALSQFARNKFIAGGIAEDKIVVKSNFVDLYPGVGSGQGGFALFVGRLVPEKGVETLLAAWSVLRDGPKLKIIGDGLLAQDVAQSAATNPSIEWLGACSREQVRDAMAQATILILPSTWYEAFPLVIAEAFAAGLPIIASRLGAMAELIADGHTGKLFAPGNAAELASTVEWVYLRPEHMQRMRISARAEYEQKYTAEANYARLMSIYEAALGHSREPALSVPQLEAIG